MSNIWKCKIPLKVQIFLWMAFQDRIQSAVQLKKRKWGGDAGCKLCGELETADHLLFSCPIAVFVWVFLKEALSLERAFSSRAELLNLVLVKKKGLDRTNLLFVCAGAMWTLWKTRNDLVFNDKLISSPMVLMYKLVALLKN